MQVQRWASTPLALLFIFVITLSLTGCQAFVPVTPTLTPAPIETPGPTATPAPPAGVLWVDTTRDLGLISKFVLGANHGPWSDLGAGNIDPAKNSGITFLRWPGGSWGDNNDIRPNLIDNYIRVARNIMHAEPSITVRFLGSTPGQAAQLVQYVNIDMSYGVKYWSIGNEPDLYTVLDETWTPEYVAERWREFALAMKAIDPSIVLIGPDISGFVGDPDKLAPREYIGRDCVALPITKRDYLTAFLKLNGDLVDIVSVHQYAFPTKCHGNVGTWDEMRDNTSEWGRIISNLHRIIKETTGKDKPVAVTEFNSSASNTTGNMTSPDSFYSALWLSDVLGRMIRQQPEILAYWILKSSSSAGSVAGHGLMDSFNLRPSYYVYQLYKQFGNHLLSTNSDTQYVSVFAAKRDDGALTLILVNLNDNEIRKPLQLGGDTALKLSEAYLFDATHKAESITPPTFNNGAEIALPADSVTLYIFK